MSDNSADGVRTSLKILMTADAVGGVWRYCMDLAEELSRAGVEITLATMGPRPSTEQRREVWAIPGVTLAESDYALEWMQDPWRDVDAAGEWLLSLERQFQPDIIHLNGYVHAALPWKRPVIVTAHSCVYSWWRAVYGESAGPEWSEYKRRITEGVRAANAVIAPSSFMARALADEYAIGPEKTAVIHNFSRARVPQSGKKEPFVLAAGRMWDRAKNLIVLDQAAARIDSEIRIAGSERSPDGFEVRAKSARVLGHITHAEILGLMCRAGIFAHPALYEPFGLSVLEAARAGCCLVLSDIPSLRELWDGAAVFLDPRNPDAWTNEINALIGDASRRESLAFAARAHAEAYDAGDSVNKYLALYSAVPRGEKAEINNGVAA